jgi:hypothetical protein
MGGGPRYSRDLRRQPTRSSLPELDNKDLLRAAARNLADWHECNLGALGIASLRDDRLWTCLDPKPVPPIYHRLITIEPDAGAQAVADEAADVEGFLSVCDSWSTLDLRSHEFTVDEESEWMARAPSTLGRIGPRALSIEKVDDEEALAEFEQASIDGFESPGLHDLGRGGLHAPRILDDENMHVYVGRVEGGRVVSVAMAYVSQGLVGVFGVATLPRYRRHGYGAAMTWAALNAEPELPSVLQPSAAGAPGYVRLGYRSAGRFRNWFRASSGNPDAIIAEGLPLDE